MQPYAHPTLYSVNVGWRVLGFFHQCQRLKSVLYMVIETGIVEQILFSRFSLEMKSLKPLDPRYS